MAIYQELSDRLKAAVKARDEFTSTLLRTVIGEIQREEKKGDERNDDLFCGRVIKKMVTNCRLVQQTLEQKGRTQDPAYEKIRREAAFLPALLPNLLSLDALRTFLKQHVDELRAAKAEGQAIGLANKNLKGGGHEYFNEDVAQVVKELRS